MWFLFIQLSGFGLMTLSEGGPGPHHLFESLDEGLWTPVKICYEISRFGLAKNANPTWTKIRKKVHLMYSG